MCVCGIYSSLLPFPVFLYVVNLRVMSIIVSYIWSNLTPSYDWIQVTSYRCIMEWIFKSLSIWVSYQKYGGLVAVFLFTHFLTCVLPLKNNCCGCVRYDLNLFGLLDCRQCYDFWAIHVFLIHFRYKVSGSIVALKAYTGSSDWSFKTSWLEFVCCISK